MYELKHKKEITEIPFTFLCTVCSNKTWHFTFYSDAFGKFTRKSGDLV